MGYELTYEPHAASSHCMAAHALHGSPQVLCAITTTAFVINHHHHFIVA